MTLYEILSGAKLIDDGSFELANYLMSHQSTIDEQVGELVEALRFYANKENWDMDDFTPTVWDNGSIDLGETARKALTRTGFGEEK